MLKKDNFSLSQNIKKFGVLDYPILDGMVDWVRVIDRDGNIIYANKAMQKAFGEHIIGSKCYQLLCNEKRCDFCIGNRTLLTGEVLQKEEVIKGKYYSVKSSPIKNSEGNIVASVEVFRDVTRERRLELELVNKNAKMINDLEFAKRIQERILPKKGFVENIKIDYIYKASGVLSGDMFDIFYIDDENIGIYISDVVGHGIAASMMTMFIRQTMRAIKDDILSPSVVLTELHRRFTILGLEADKYFTIFYGVYNKNNHTFKFANAGHNCAPIKYNDDYLELLEMKGYPITLLFDEIEYEEKYVKLNKHDKILFYTDGITEAKDYQGNEFGVEGVIDIINKNPNDLLAEIDNKIISHNWGEQKDDFALVLMEVLK